MIEKNCDLLETKEYNVYIVFPNNDKDLTISNFKSLPESYWITNYTESPRGLKIRLHIDKRTSSQDVFNLVHSQTSKVLDISILDDSNNVIAYKLDSSGKPQNYWGLLIDEFRGIRLFNLFGDYTILIYIVLGYIVYLYFRRRK